MADSTGGRVVPADDPVLRWCGAVSLQHGPGWVAPWRLPYEEAALHLPEGGTGRAAMPAGVRVVLRTDSARLTCRTAAEEVSFTLRQGETLGLVGESGSGKSTVARMGMGLLAPDTGTVLLDGSPWPALSERRRRPLRHRIQLVHQDPYSAFDPRLTVARSLAEALPRTGRAARSRELLELVGLKPEHLARRPHQLSGGQRQRLAIARALAPGPMILVCDEPVSALDASVREQVLTLLEELQQRLGLALLFISHDLSVIRRISDRVLVMKDAGVVEEGPASEVLRAPAHPYTKALLAAAPVLPTASDRDPGPPAGPPSRPPSATKDHADRTAALPLRTEGESVPRPTPFPQVRP